MTSSDNTDQDSTSGSGNDDSLVSEIMDVCHVDACRSHSGETARDTDSTVSLMGDSDADLSYSEEEVDQSGNDDMACKPSMSFYQSENDSEASIETEPMEVDESPPEAESHSNSTLPGILINNEECQNQVAHACKSWSVQLGYEVQLFAISNNA
ncbi:MAG: hypothetical protein AB2693_17135 [Candidatus Thiodiazotropha sp.]